MKKLLFLFVFSSFLMSCEIEDDGPNMVMAPAEVTETDLPESFEEGKSYVVEVTYLLPDACHVPAGIHVYRGASFGDARRDIYVSGVASYEYGTECDKESDNLDRTSTFRIDIDEDEPYTFYLWTGVDEDNKDIFTEVVVPVGAPATPAE